MKRILLIEDDPLIARLYSSKYATAGFETRIAEDGETGLALLETFKPDLVHLDLMVPKLNGLEVVKRMRSSPDFRSVPIVVLSNTYQNHLVKAVMAAGATELVSKATCTPRMMLEIVEKLRSRMSDGAKPGAAPIASPTPSPGPGVERRDATAVDRHATLHREVVEGLLLKAPQALASMRDLMPELLQIDAAARAPHLSSLIERARPLVGPAALAGFHDLARLLSALVALLTELVETPSAVTDSSLRTIVDTCDFLPELLAAPPDAPLEERAPTQVLVVDDDAICRLAVRKALGRIGAATLTVGDPRVALKLAGENPFSLICLDAEMPDLNGFELCRELRRTPANAATPVVFVTTLEGFESRDQAMASGANDLIAKPFLPMELALKALSLLRRPMAT